MTDFRALEYDSLRATIRVRSTLRPALLVLAILGWAALTLWVFTTDVVSAATLVPLLLLAAAFEALYALQVSVERIARYLQIEYEQPAVSTPSSTETPPAGSPFALRAAAAAEVKPAAPRWETASLSYSQRFSSPGPNALFGAIFIITTAVNYLPAALSGTFEELAGLGLAHGLFLVRVIVASRRASRLRTDDLERFRTLLAVRPTPSSTTGATSSTNTGPSV